MVLIKDSKDNNRSTPGGYHRLFDNEELGGLFSKVHAAVIRNGNELENIIIEKCDCITDVDNFFSEHQNDGVYLIEKKVIKKSTLKSNQEPDFIILKVDNENKHCYIVELKDGDTFDTKKAAGEKALLTNFQRDLSIKIPYTSSIHVCAFNQLDKEKIVAGFKNKISEDEAMTGMELCRLLDINYQEILTDRRQGAESNIDYFLESLMNIDLVQTKIKLILSE